MTRAEQPPNSVTIRDVAREAGVSYATVSRVLNNKAHVKPEKREAVLRFRFIPSSMRCGSPLLQNRRCGDKAPRRIKKVVSGETPM